MFLPKAAPSAFPVQADGLFNGGIGVPPSKSDFSMFEAPKLPTYQERKESRAQTQCVGMYWDSAAKCTRIVPLGPVFLRPALGPRQSCSVSTTATNSQN